MTAVNPFYYVFAAAALALIPIVLSLFTSYLKLSIVFGMIKSALGVQQAPGTAVVMALSLLLTFFIMGPVFEEISANLGKEQMEGILKRPWYEGVQSVVPALAPWQKFLRGHAGQRELRTMQELDARRGGKMPDQDSGGAEEPSFSVLAAAFLLSELKQAFAMSFVLLLPFLAIDLIVANILAGLGMFMVSPAMISLPLKLILFVLSDGWLLLAKAMVNSYQG